MANWKFTVTSINGRTIVGGSILAAYFTIGNGPLFTRQNRSVVATVPGKGTSYVRSQPQPEYVRLRVIASALTEAALKDIRTMFNEDEGLVYLRLTDGDGVVWRTSVVVEATEPAIGVIGHDVVIFIPDPVWEEDTVTATDRLNQTASPISMTLTNNGSRKAKPQFMFTADVAKDNSRLGYQWSLRGWLVNRAPNPLSRFPMALFDQAGAAARLATDTGTAGARVKRTDISNQINNGAGITASATTITVDTAVGGGLPAAGGLAYIVDAVNGDEQISFTTNAGGTSLTGVVRGLGGTTAVIHPDNAVIDFSTMLKNGDDIRVWQDGAQVKRWFASMNTSATEVWANVTLPKRLLSTLVAAMTASVPAIGSTFALNEGTADLSPSGFLVVDSEVIAYSAKDDSAGTVLVAKRGAWGSTAASHSANASVYANPVQYVISAGYAAATSPPAPAAERPCIQLPGSSNQVHKYGDGANDSASVYYEGNNPDRSAMWKLGFDKDGNDILPLIQIQNSAAMSEAKFTDAAPGDGSPPTNNIVLECPIGIKANDVNAIQNTWTSAIEILNSELWTRDDGGLWKLQDQLQSGAAPANRALPAVLAVDAYAVKLKARYNIITGFKGDDTPVVTANNASSSSTPTAGQIGLRFTLDRDTYVKRLIVRCQTTGAGNQVISLMLQKDGSSVPGGNAAGYLVSFGDYTFTVIGTTITTYQIDLKRGALYRAGVYWAVFQREAPLVTNVNFVGSSFSAQIIDAVSYSGTVWQGLGDDAPQLYVCGDYDSVGNAFIQPDQPVLVLGTQLRTFTNATFDKTILTWDTSQSPYVNRNTAFVSGATAGAMHHLSGTILNTTTGDSIAIDKWMAIGSTLTIDTDTGTVEYVEDGITYAVRGCLDPSNGSDMMPLAPGANVVTYTDAALLAGAQIDWQATHRSKKV